MDSSPPNQEPRRITWIDRVQALFEILLISGLISSVLASLLLFALQGKDGLYILANVRGFSAFLLLEAAITFLILTILLKARHETIQKFGLQWDRWKFNLALGLTLVPFLFLINGVVGTVFRIYLPKYYAETNPIMELIHSPQQLALIIFSALIAGGIKEEVQRAFILTRFQECLGGAWPGLILWSLSFGVGHYVQGVHGVVIASIFGALFGILYLRTGSLIAPIVAHGAYDALALLAYWIFSGHPK
jgi:membrane protease YdiL (CAAX protease family)